MKLIVLDRDGVINEDSDAFVKSTEEWLPLPGSIEAIARFKQAGWLVAIATNQSGLARGLFPLETLHAMHDKMHDLLAPYQVKVDLITYCPHGPDDACECRKPLPGLFNTIAQHYGLADLSGVPVVGDSLRDLQGGVALNATPMLVLTGKGEKTARGTLPEGTQIFADLSAVADYLLNSTDAPTC